MNRNLIWKWIPSVIIMGVIFFLSSQPGDKLPNFNWADRLVKKTGHMAGYGLLAISYWYALGADDKKRWPAWLFAVLYAITDEVHQSYIPGRHASVWDVVIFDNFGAIISLWLAGIYFKSEQPNGLTSDRLNPRS